MPALLKILVPEDTTNYVTNPAFRYNTTGYLTVGASLTRSLDYARFGVASGMVVTNGSILREGIYYRINSLVGQIVSVTASVYVRGSGSVHIRLIENPTGNEWVSVPIALRSDRWQRISVSGSINGSNDIRIYVETDGPPKAITFYADGFQLETKSFVTTYCDGDQLGCRWNIVSHNSLSTRDANTRQGGRWLHLAGPCRRNDDIYLTVLSGMGMAPMTNNTQSWALDAGSYFQNNKVSDRVITLEFTTKHVIMHLRGAPDLSNLHRLRQSLVDIFKPDRTGSNESFMLSYQEGDRAILVKARYEAGLDGDWDLRNPWYNSFPVRLLAVEPYLFEDDQEVVQLDYNDTIPCVGGHQIDSLRRVNGQWLTMPDPVDPVNYPGLSLSVEVFAEGKYHEIYAGGQFHHAFSGLNYIAKWNGATWESLGGGANGRIRAIAIAQNGDVYVTGDFTTIGGVAANYIARWDGSTWNALLTGLNASGYSLCMDPSGQLYVGGAFTTAGWLPTLNIARWDGSSWHACSPSVITPIDVVLSIVKCVDGYLYFCAQNQHYLYKIDTALSKYSTVGAALTHPLVCLTQQIDGKIYGICREITSTPDYVYCWNGVIWSALPGSLTNDSSNWIFASPNGTLYVCGLFAKIGTVACRRIAKYVGGVWHPLDMIPAELTTTVEGMTVLESSQGDLYFGLALAGTSSYVSGITVVTNSGTAEVYPKVYVKGPAKLCYLENVSTKKCCYFDLTVQTDEEITIDFGAGTIISNTRGNLFSSILPGSDFKSWTLIPGDNRIAAFMYNETSPVMQITYIPRHWSADASARPEAFG